MPTKKPQAEPSKVTDRPIVILLTAVISAFVAGVGCIVYIHKEIEERVVSQLKQMQKSGEFPQGPQGLVGPPGRTGSSIPLGSIVAAGCRLESVPAGWLPCDGREIGVSTNLELYEVIGNTFGGTPDVMFRLPDLQGRFLRGVDPKGSRDPDGKDRKPMFQGGSGGNNVGSVQDFATSATGLEGRLDIPNSASSSSDNEGGRLASGGDGYEPGFKMSLPAALTGSKETRPINANVLWIIRVSN